MYSDVIIYLLLFVITGNAWVCASFAYNHRTLTWQKFSYLGNAITLLSTTSLIFSIILSLTEIGYWGILSIPIIIVFGIIPYKLFSLVLIDLIAIFSPIIILIVTAIQYFLL